MASPVSRAGGDTATGSDLALTRARYAELLAAAHAAVAAERKLTDGDLTLLNNANINAIYPVPGSGMTIMGARTLKKFGLDMYVNVRRSIIDIAELGSPSV